MNKNVLLDPFRVLGFFFSQNSSVLGTPCSHVLTRVYGQRHRRKPCLFLSDDFKEPFVLRVVLVSINYDMVDFL